MDGDVETEELNEALVLAKAEESRKVVRVVLVGINSREFALAVDVVEDAAGNVGQLGNAKYQSQCMRMCEHININSQVHRVLERRPPVLLLVDTLLVRLRERRVVVQGSDGERELGHGVERRRAAVEDLLDELGDRGACGPVAGELLDLLRGRDLAGDEEPEETLGERLGAAGSLGEGGLDLGDGLAAEADTLICQQLVRTA